MARPNIQMQKLESQKELFESVMQFYPPKIDVVGLFKVSESTLDRFVKKHYHLSYDDFRDKSFGKTRMAIRQKQIEKALDGNNAMLIWCGKQYLDQSEKVDSKTTLLNSDAVKKITINWGDEADGTPNQHETSNPTAETH